MAACSRTPRGGSRGQGPSSRRGEGHWHVSFTLRGATLIDGTGSDPLRGHAVTVEGDRIARVGTVERGGSEVDLDGLTLLPGLIDAHTHLAASRRPGLLPAR